MQYLGKSRYAGLRNGLYTAGIKNPINKIKKRDDRINNKMITALKEYENLI